MINISYFTQKINDILLEYYYDPDKKTDNSELLIYKLNKINSLISQ